MPITTWYIRILLADFDQAQDLADFPNTYALGPIDSWSRARELAQKWEREFGVGTTEVTDELPGEVAARAEAAS